VRNAASVTLLLLCFSCVSAPEKGKFDTLSPGASPGGGQTHTGSGGAGGQGGAGGAGGAGGQGGAASSHCAKAADACETTGKCVVEIVGQPTKLVCTHFAEGDACDDSVATCTAGSCRAFVSASGVEKRCTTCAAAGAVCEGSGICVIALTPSGFDLVCGHGGSGEPCTIGTDCKSGLCSSAVTPNGVAKLCF
jgi:hypothetical protein